MKIETFKKIFILIGFCLGGLSFVNASEITGQLSTGSTMSGTVGGGQPQVTSQANTTSYGGGGGGGMVIPGAGYSYGSYSNGSNMSMGLQPMTPNSYPAPVATVPADNYDYDGIGGLDSIYANLAQTTTDDNMASDSDIDETATNSSTTIIETPIMSTTTVEDDSMQPGAYDFFGISIWFWTVIFLLLILIIAILYMQSL
jgi:hypothetical protein